MTSKLNVLIITAIRAVKEGRKVCIVSPTRAQGVAILDLVEAVAGEEIRNKIEVSP